MLLQAQLSRIGGSKTLGIGYAGQKLDQTQWISPYGSPVLIVQKETGKQQICINFRALNANKNLDAFPLPYIADLLDKLGKAKYFSSIDLPTAYHLVRIAKGNTDKAVFFTNEGLYKYVVIPFGVYNAPATFQRLMKLTFAACINEFVTIYLDNTGIF